MAQLIDSSIFIALERRRQPLSALASVAPDEPVALAVIDDLDTTLAVSFTCDTHCSTPLSLRRFCRILSLRLAVFLFLAL
jgi:hypothetical protein